MYSAFDKEKWDGVFKTGSGPGEGDMSTSIRVPDQID